MENSLAFSFNDKEFTDFLPEDPREQYGTRWADFNIHDPGVTTYEALQFSYEDFTYRFNLPIRVLLQGTKGNAFSSWSVHDLRPYYAVTPDDYRGVLAQLKSVVNAAVYPCTRPNIGQGTLVPKSLLTLEAAAFSSDLTLFGDRLVVRFRALGEYFNRKPKDRHFLNSNMKPVDVKVKVSFKYREDSDLNKAKLICAVREFLLPRLKPMDFRYLKNGQELIESNLFGTTDVLNSKHVISAQAMHKVAYRDSIAVSEIYDVLESLHFLKSVNKVEIALSSKGNFTGTVLPLGSFCFTPLNKIKINADDFTQVIPDLPCENEDSIIVNMETELKLARDHKLGKFYSIQESFPSNYGIGPNLSDKTPSELEKSGNFRGYLYFLDQVRADFLAQLGTFPQLFTVNDVICGIQQNSLKNHPYYKDLDITPKYCSELVPKDSLNCNEMYISPVFREHRLNYLLAQNGWNTDREIPTETETETLLRIKREFLDLVHHPYKRTNRINSDLNFIFRSKSLVMLQEMVRVLLQTEVIDVRVLEHVFLQPVWSEERSMDFDITIFLFSDKRELIENLEFVEYLHKLIRELVPVHILFNVVWCDQVIYTFDAMLNAAYPANDIFYFDNKVTRHQHQAMIWLLSESERHRVECE